MMEKQRPSAPVWARWIYVVVVVLIFLPLLWMFVGAFLQTTEAGVMWTLHWFEQVFLDKALVAAFGRSLWVGFCSSVLATILGTIGAFVLVKRGLAGQILAGFNIVILMLPEIIFALSLLSWFILFQFSLGLMTVIFAHVTFSLSYVMLTVMARLRELDQSFVDAAQDLGASEWQVLTRVTLPLLKPAILSGFVLSYLLSFDDFLITFFVNGPGNDTLPVKLFAALKMGMSPKLNALSSLMFVITFVGFIVLYKTRKRSAQQKVG